MSTPNRFSTTEHAPDRLYERVMVAVGHARTRAVRIRLAISSLLIASSGIGTAFAVRATLRAASASGFDSFASLALTDTSIIVRHAQEFLLSLVETLPGIQVALSLLGISVLLVSVRSFVRTFAPVPRIPIIRHS